MLPFWQPSVNKCYTTSTSNTVFKLIWAVSESLVIIMGAERVVVATTTQCASGGDGIRLFE